MTKLRLLAFALISAQLTGCMFVSAVKTDANQTLDAARLSRVKTVAIMPFFNANGLATDDPDPAYTGKYADLMPTTIVYGAIKDKTRFEWLSLDRIVPALKKNGFKGIELKPGEELSMMSMMFNSQKYRTGFTMDQALKTGRQLKADAILIGAMGMVGNAPANTRTVMALRLIDTKTGDVLWGAAKAEDLPTSLLHPLDAYKAQLASMAQNLIAEAK